MNYHRHPYPRNAREPYPRTWDAVRKAKLRRNPQCEEPLCPFPATEVDHVDGDKRNLAPSNLMSLCHSHHSRKTVMHDGGFGRVKRRATNRDG